MSFASASKTIESINSYQLMTIFYLSIDTLYFPVSSVNLVTIANYFNKILQLLFVLEHFCDKFGNHLLTLIGKAHK